MGSSLQCMLGVTRQMEILFTPEKALTNNASKQDTLGVGVYLKEGGKKILMILNQVRRLQNAVNLRQISKNNKK